LKLLLDLLRRKSPQVFTEQASSSPSLPTPSSSSSSPSTPPPSSARDKVPVDVADLLGLSAEDDVPGPATMEEEESVDEEEGEGEGGWTGALVDGDGDGLVMVFVNTAAMAADLTSALAAQGVRCLGFHSLLRPAQRRGNLAAFQKGSRCRLLVCTDSAARGLDIARVDHVVQVSLLLPPPLALT
jgi:superfamily II DNA/RNA helicase